MSNSLIKTRWAELPSSTRRGSTQILDEFWRITKHRNRWDEAKLDLIKIICRRVTKGSQLKRSQRIMWCFVMRATEGIVLLAKRSDLECRCEYVQNNTSRWYDRRTWTWCKSWTFSTTNQRVTLPSRKQNSSAAIRRAKRRKGQAAELLTSLGRLCAIAVYENQSPSQEGHTDGSKIHDGIKFNVRWFIRPRNITAGGSMYYSDWFGANLLSQVCNYSQGSRAN